MGFIELLKRLTAKNYSALANEHILPYTRASINLPSLLCLHQALPGNGFQQCPLPPLSPAGHHLTNPPGQS
jgi:hypothetical protein